VPYLDSCRVFMKKRTNLQSNIWHNFSTEAFYCSREVIIGSLLRISKVIHGTSTNLYEDFIIQNNIILITHNLVSG